MRSAFDEELQSSNIELILCDQMGGNLLYFKLQNDNEEYSPWRCADSVLQDHFELWFRALRKQENQIKKQIEESQKLQDSITTETEEFRPKINTLTTTLQQWLEDVKSQQENHLTLMISDESPRFFAVDNIDASLNPKLCSRLMKELAELAENNDKQVILTTHNPAILDGPNLDNEEHKLYVVSRNKNGETKLRRIRKKKPLPGQHPIKLSEAFMKGYVGELPNNF